MWGRQVHFLYIRISASPNERFTFSDCGAPHMRFTVSAEPDETGALIITTAFDTLSDGKTHWCAQSYLNYQDTHADGSE